MWWFFPTMNLGYGCSVDFWESYQKICVQEKNTLIVLCPRKYCQEKSTLENIIWEVWSYNGQRLCGQLLYTKGTE